ncbi:succinate-semialdehyde dehydrogenase [Thiothrix lacustris]|nr:succinate-semialdehyde dehydrogenase [Thiothrix lacustris]WMP18385.1 succinate-semialdehyde dehydrogenase [Thiothrix lacustris]
MIPLKNPDLLRSHCYINGAWVAADDGDTLSVTNPATGEIITTVPRCSAAQTRVAIDGATLAQREWRKRTAADRANILHTWHHLMLEHQEDLAQIMTAEQGKPLAESRGEIAYAAAFIQWFAEEGKRTYGDVIPSPFPNSRIVVIKEPVGVCAAITPWNFPAAMITRKAAPALAAGCAMVVKPAEQTPLSALALAVLAEQAGVPAGIFSVVTGDPHVIGGELTSNDKVRKLSFTGSTAVGRLLMQQCAPTLKKLSLELGGNAPFIVFDDADLDAAVAGAVASKYRNAGQTCVCTNRFLVQTKVYDAFAEKLAQAVAKLKVGHGTESDVNQGPLIDEAALCKVEALVADAVQGGAKIVGGGGRHALGGTFYTPTVLTGVLPNMRVAKEEIFGPVAPLFRFDTEEEAIQMANDTEYGLAAYLYARDIGRVWRVSEALEYGMVGINSGIISTEVAPFGGQKSSGLGREGSKYGIEEYLEIKYLHMGL